MRIVLKRVRVLNLSNELFNMPPTTRSTSRSATATPVISSRTTSGSNTLATPTKAKRKAAEVNAELAPTPTTKKSRKTPAKGSTVNVKATVEQSSNGGSIAIPKPVPARAPEDEEPAPVPAVLTFSFEDAKSHLISVDKRFEYMFSKMECKPFEILERVHPFRALATSIIGQQVSWIAARSINHKFVRLYNPTLPENVKDYLQVKDPDSFFPSPRQVANTDLGTLRTAGLSGRKAEYLQDLAARFADGRLSTEKLLQADDDELADMLIEVRGIGRWTVDMFAIFSLRRPDILPVGDLGVQRGLVRWFLSQHSPTHSFSLSPQKLVTESGGDGGPKSKDVNEKNTNTLPATGLADSGDRSPSHPAGAAEQVAPDASSLLAPAPMTPKKKVKADAESDTPIGHGPPLMPAPATPSINELLSSSGADEGPSGPLPEGLTVTVLKSRLEGKKIKGALLTPKEMEDLTTKWRPYRSVGIYFMWSLEAPTT